MCMYLAVHFWTLKYSKFFLFKLYLFLFCPLSFVPHLLNWHINADKSQFIDCTFFDWIFFARIRNLEWQQRKQKSTFTAISTGTSDFSLPSSLFHFPCYVKYFLRFFSIHCITESDRISHLPQYSHFPLENFT